MSGTDFVEFLALNCGNASLQCHSVVSDILIKNELCIQLERESMFYLQVKVSFAYLRPGSTKSNRCAFLFYLQKDNFVQCCSVLCALHPITNYDYVT